MICLECSKLDLRKQPKHAAAGVGKCEHEQLAGTFVSIAHRRDCKSFEKAADDVIEKRMEWWNKK
ncbi:MAG TPA: hypothetical protein VN081_06835 [Dongiaceae bacterium]|nr:hypothetical protein [Dongiaceae bacterium]